MNHIHVLFFFFLDVWFDTISQECDSYEIRVDELNRDDKEKHDTNEDHDYDEKKQCFDTIVSDRVIWTENETETQKTRQ